MTAFAVIPLEILWNPLLAVADAAATTSMRTSFSTAQYPQQTIMAQPDDLPVFSTPGGAGYGESRQQSPWQVHAEVQAGAAAQDAAEAVRDQTPAAYVLS